MEKPESTVSQDNECSNSIPHKVVDACPIPVHVSTYPRRASQLTDMDDDITLTDVTAISQHASQVTNESIQLSLSESFDDAFLITKQTQRCDRNVTSETRFLYEKLLSAKRIIDCLRGQINKAKRGIDTIQMDENEYRDLKRIPENQLDLLQRISIVINEVHISKQQEIQSLKINSQNQIFLLEQQRDEALHAKKMSDRREKGLCESLEHSEQRQYELEKEIKELNLGISGLKKKGEEHAKMKNKIEKLETDSKIAQKVIDENKEQLSNCKSIEANLRQSVSDFERKVQILEMDKTYLQKENGVLTERCSYVENDYKRKEAALEELVIKNENLMLKLSETKCIEKTEYCNRIADEINRAREESKIDFDRTIEHTKLLHEKERNLLRESKNELADRLEKTANDLQIFRSKYDDIVLEKSEVIHSLEKDISKVESELNLKNFELTKLSSKSEDMRSELNEIRAENGLLKERVEAHAKQFRSLEQETMYEKKSLLDELTRKNEEIKKFSESLKFDGNVPSPHKLLLGKTRKLSESNIQNNMDANIIEKLKDSQTKVDELSNLLDEQRKINEDLKSKYAISEGMLNRLNGPQNYVENTLKVQEEALRCLQNDNETLIKEVKILRNENEDLYRKLQDTPIKYTGTVGIQGTTSGIDLCPNHINEEEKIGASPLRPGGSTRNALNRKVKGSNEKECPFDDHGSILSLHLVHHGGKRLRVKEK